MSRNDKAKRDKAAYMGSMYGFEFASRVGEYTHPESRSVDHCARVDDFAFVKETVDAVINVPGSELGLLKLVYSVSGWLSITECRVKTVTSKGKTVVKPKLNGWRSPEVAAFLDDLAS